MSSTEQKEWISIAEMQMILGIGRTKAYELVISGELPAIRVGRCIRVNRKELEDWLRDQRYLDMG